MLYLLYTVSAQTPYAHPVYSRTYLRGLKRLEIERVQAELINNGITMVEDIVFTAAKQGLLQYTTEPFNGCEAYTSQLAVPYNLDKASCEYIVNGIKALVSQRFPDSELLYDFNTKQYTLKWD
jgi:hypothetical protein